MCARICVTEKNKQTKISDITWHLSDWGLVKCAPKFQTESVAEQIDLGIVLHEIDGHDRHSSAVEIHTGNEVRSLFPLGATITYASVLLFLNKSSWSTGSTIRVSNCAERKKQTKKMKSLEESSESVSNDSQVLKVLDREPNKDRIFLVYLSL